MLLLIPPVEMLGANHLSFWIVTLFCVFCSQKTRFGVLGLTETFLGFEILENFS